MMWASMNIDAVITALYDCMCFEVAGRPDWDRLSEILAPGARLVRVNDDGVFEFDPVTFRGNIEEMMASGSLPSFWEGELSREIQDFTDVAHVLSIYEARSSRNAAVLFRAVKSIQLFRRDGRWWINSLLWRSEGPDFRIDPITHAVSLSARSGDVRSGTMESATDYEASERSPR
jgi:hypothetical protein